MLNVSVFKVNDSSMKGVVNKVSDENSNRNSNRKRNFLDTKKPMKLMVVPKHKQMEEDRDYEMLCLPI